MPRPVGLSTQLSMIMTHPFQSLRWSEESGRVIQWNEPAKSPTHYKYHNNTITISQQTNIRNFNHAHSASIRTPHHNMQHACHTMNATHYISPQFQTSHRLDHIKPATITWQIIRLGTHLAHRITSHTKSQYIHDTPHPIPPHITPHLDHIGSISGACECRKIVQFPCCLDIDCGVLCVVTWRGARGAPVPAAAAAGALRTCVKLCSITVFSFFLSSTTTSSRCCGGRAR